MFEFEIHASDGAARTGTLRLPHGAVETPVFMPVGTLASVKTLAPEEVAALGAQIILNNTYHLFLRPGAEVVRELGGLHRFQNWDGPILTDSGGFQVFSLAEIRTISEEGVTFRSHIDGSRHLFTPERVMEIERALGADVVMAFDHCPPGQAERAVAEAASRRTLEWLARCRARFLQLADEEPAGPSQTLFPIVQGGVYPELRRDAARATLELGHWDGVAIGGLSVGEPKPVMYEMLEALQPVLPTGLPRYLMGVGYPDDLLHGIARGVDMFDCVAPTRNGRNGTAWVTERGAAQHQGGALPQRRRAAGPAVRLLHLPHLHAGLPAAPVRGRRVAEHAAAVHPQPALPGGPGRARTRGDPRGGFLGVEPRLAGALPRGAPRRGLERTNPSRRGEERGQTYC